MPVQCLVTMDLQSVSKLSFILCTYSKVASRNTCYYSENQVFGGATNQDMSLNETCFVGIGGARQMGKYFVL